jgi:hypothetical protein
MAAELFTDSFEFRLVVRLLREMAPEFRVMALLAAMFWSDERLANFNDVRTQARHFLRFEQQIDPMARGSCRVRSRVRQEN